MDNSIATLLPVDISVAVALEIYVTRAQEIQSTLPTDRRGKIPVINFNVVKKLIYLVGFEKRYSKEP